jgi:hypothetical protein
VLKECTKVMLGDGKGSSGSSSGSGSVSGSTVTCAKPKACASGKTAVYGKDKNNCAVLKSCEAKCPPLPTCGENGGWLDLHKDKNGCSVGHCERRWNR